MGPIAEPKGKVIIGRREYPLKDSPLFFKKMGEFYIKATTVQLRTLAYAAKDYMVDKILAQSIQGGPQRVLRNPAKPKELLSEPKMQQLQELDLEIVKQFVVPPRDTDPEKLIRVPFRVLPLSKGWIKTKRAKKFDPRQFIATGDYLRGIVVRRRQNRKGAKGITYVVTMAHRKHRYSNISLQRLALIQEYGTASYTVALFGDENRRVTIQLPPRPHWRPTYRMLKHEFQRIGPNANAAAIKEAVAYLS